MSIRCIDCKKCEKDDQYCRAGMWDREDDEFLKSDNDFNDYLKKERFCSEFKPNK